MRTLGSALTGAGISKASGLSTFREPDGIWARVRIEDVATPEAFARDPDRVHRFYNERRRGLVSADVAPNAAHLALARLEAEHGGEVLVVTQNIDDLHERAGTRNLIHMHGELLKARCTACGNVHAWRDDLDVASTCRSCWRSIRPLPQVSAPILAAWSRPVSGLTESATSSATPAPGG